MLRLFKKTPDGLEEFDLLEGSINIPLTTAQTNPTNPTKYITEYSKDVKLPLTPHNLQLMDFYPEMDSVILSGRYSPTTAMEVVVCNDNDIIFEGKMKLEKVNDYRGNRSLECTLYGKMNEFFNQMLNTTYWYDAENEQGDHVNKQGMKVMDNILDTGYNICKETVLESWKTLPIGYVPFGGLHVATLTPSRQNTYNPSTSQSHSIIAWAPTEQGQYSKFIADKVIIGLTNTGSSDPTPNISYGPGELVDILGDSSSHRYYTVDAETKAIAEAVLGDGFSERQWCQYRSYYQKPTVYVNQLWRQYQDIAEEVTGLQLELDEDWFNANNSRYTDIVYTLPDLIQDNKEDKGSQNSNDISFDSVVLDCHNYAFGTSGGANASVSVTSTSSPNVQNGHIIIPAGNTGYYNFQHQMVLHLSRHGSLSDNSEYALCDGDGTASCIDLQVAFRNVNDSTEPASYYNWKIVAEGNTTWQGVGVDTMIYLETKSWNPDPQDLYFNLEGEILIGQNNTNTDKEYEMVISAYCYNGNIDGGSGQALFQSRGRIVNINALCDSCNDCPVFTFTNVTSTITVTAEHRSYFPLEMKDLFPANYSPFNILLQYTKLFNLVWDYDQLRNKVTVMTKEKWFSLHQDDIYNWTDKVDKSREFAFKPLAWDKKHISFNYNDFEMDWLDDFKEKYGLTYGTKKITTQYNFNNENEDLMCNSDADKINPSLLVSSSRFPMSALSSSNPIFLRYYESFIGNRKNNKAANIWGQFFFRNGNTSWDTDNGKNSVWTNYTPSGEGAVAFRNVGICIVDDTPYQVRRNLFAVDMTVYAYNQAYKVNVPTTVRPIFSVFNRNGVYSCQFSKPAMTFYDNQASEFFNTTWITIPITGTRVPIRIPVETLATDIYTNRWSNIIAEQYSEQNKLLTCYVKLNGMDFRNLTCNRFVRIGNVLYSIYKVNDFQLGVGGLTKVELLQVWDMKKYLGEYYVDPEPEPEPVGPDYTEPFYVENISNEEETLSIVKSNSNAPTLTIEYSTDKTTWNTLGTTSTTALTRTLAPGEKVYLRCSTNVWYSNYNGNNIIGISKVGGNIMSLLYGSNFTGEERTFPNNDSYSLGYLFYSGLSNISRLQNASELLLPATTLTEYCYYSMFMNCSSLTSAPELPATTLVSYCYSYMFYGCTSLTSAPELPATTLARGCYFTMFSECTSLNHIICQATDISASLCTYNWVSGVSSTGTFETPNPSIWTRGVSGIPEGWLVVSGD